ncbi:hypothetical protein LCGC14_2937350, partial [marine sediment metagenome]
MILQYALPSLFIGIVGGYFLRRYIVNLKVASAKETAGNILKEAQKEAEAKKREAILETKDQLFKERSNFERETRERRAELQRLEKRLLQKEENLDKRVDVLDKKEKLITNRERMVDAKESELKKDQEEIRKELERISGLTAEEVKNMLIKSLEEESRRDAQITINLIETEAKVLKQMSSNPVCDRYITCYYDYFLHTIAGTDDRPSQYLIVVTDYITGESLQQILLDQVGKGNFDMNKLLQMMFEIAQAVDYI